MNRILIKILLLFGELVSFLLANRGNCSLPNECFIQRINYDSNEFTYEKDIIRIEYYAVKCVIKDSSYKFEFKNLSKLKSCEINSYNKDRVIIESPRTAPFVLGRSFDLPNLLTYLKFFNWFTDLYFINLKGIGIDLNNKNDDIIVNNPSTSKLYCIGCTMDFYTNSNKLISSCDDIIDSNSTVLSFFQIKLNFQKILVLDSCNYPNNICPLVFKNTNIESLALTGLVDSFYKRNTLTFTNDVFVDLNSTVFQMQLSKVENIKLDSNFLNPSVFRNLLSLHIYGSVKSIDTSLYKTIEYLRLINFAPLYFRKLMHENGIDWIKEANNNIKSVDLKNFSQLYESLIENMPFFKMISLTYANKYQNIPFSEVFPDEDFCIYRDFPFDRLVALMQYNEFETLFLIHTDGLTCTYLWLSQYLPYYYQIFSNDTIFYWNIKPIIESDSFKQISKCNFEMRLELCNKTNFKITNIWSSIDYTLLNKKLQTAIKVSSYLISFLGLITNMLVIVLIMKKDNSDLFKQIKQYSYLCLNSLFCLLILSINVLSWMTECFYPFKVFCPEIRKVVLVQFFKIIFKECLTTTFRFMLNFSYVAFALNRIGLISKEKNKLVKFMCDVGIKKYIAVCFLISAGLSVMKYFKYETNYSYPSMNYPISTEWDIFYTFLKASHTFDDAFFVINLISDITNYILFVLITMIIDIYMVHELRKIIRDKIQKMKSLYGKFNRSKFESEKSESEDVINKAIQMVVINSMIGVLFKMPVSFIPIINVYAEFYYKDLNNINNRPRFDRFYLSLFQTGFYSQILEFADLLFIISISTQLFIYKRFDKKMQMAFDRLKLKRKRKITRKTVFDRLIQNIITI